MVAGRALWNQEYGCSFSGVIPGAYYTLEISGAEAQGRVSTVDVAKDMPVHVAWDLGISDSTALVCFQVQPGRIHVVDYYENNGHPAAHYCEWLNDRGYRGTDFVPHDAKVREWSTGRTRLETLRMMGRKPRLIPEHRLIDGINAARTTIPLTHFDASRCSRLLDCLRSYAAEWDENARTFKKTPAHNWASHGADAFRYMAMGWREPLDPEAEKPDPIKELLKPRTWNDVWDLHINERIEDGEEIENWGFNLNG